MFFFCPKDIRIHNELNVQCRFICSTHDPSTNNGRIRSRTLRKISRCTNCVVIIICMLNCLKKNLFYIKVLATVRIPNFKTAKKCNASHSALIQEHSLKVVLGVILWDDVLFCSVIDINECDNPDNCLYGTCVNVPGSYLCQCPPEKVLNPTGTACIGKSQALLFIMTFDL